MRKKVLCLILIAIYLISFSAAYANNEDLIVHITKTGTCYHRANCGALRSDIEVTLRYAVENGYHSCSRCNPPSPDFEYTSTHERSKRESSGSSGSSSSSGSGSFNHNSGNGYSYSQMAPETPSLLSCILQIGKTIFSSIIFLMLGAYLVFMVFCFVVLAFQSIQKSIASLAHCFKLWWRRHINQ